MTAIVYPMFAMVLLMIIVLLTTATYRIKLLRARKVHPKFYKTFQGQGGEDLPPRFAQLTNNFTNLTQMPTVFFAACCTVLALKLADPLLVNLAWGYVALRALHSLIHTTYNTVTHRFGAFVLSNFVLVIMWVNIVMSVR